MQRVTCFWAEVRHCPGFDDDGHVSFWNERKAPRAVRPEFGLNGHVGTWTSIHPVYWDPDDDLDDSEAGSSVASRAEAARALLSDWLVAERPCSERALVGVRERARQMRW